jgi:hypothetical protein
MIVAMSMIPPARPPRRLPRPTPSFVEPAGNPLDSLGRNYLRGSEQQVRRQADEGRGVLNFLNPVPSVTSAVAEGRAPRFSDVALDAGLLAAGLIPIGGPAAKAGLTVTGVGDAGRLSALIRRLNKSEDVGDFITPETMRNAARPNEGREGLYRPGAETFDYKNVPEPASPYTFGLVETEKLAPMREFDRMAAPAGLGAVGPDNVQKLMDHMAQGGKLSDPVALAWYMDPKFAYLAEGNHRLAMAEQLGLEKLPATVWRQEYGAPPMGKFLGKDDRSEIYGPVGQRLEIDRGQLMREPWEEALYVPPTMHPYLFPSLRPNNTPR